MLDFGTVTATRGSSLLRLKPGCDVEVLSLEVTMPWYRLEWFLRKY
jgi:hypothetical protein